VDGEELLRGEAPFVADTSTWWRAATLPDDLGSLIQRAVLDDRFWITPIVRMEILYSARTGAEYAALESELDALRILRNDRAVADAARGALGELAQHADGYHRVPPTDALIAAAADGAAFHAKRHSCRSLLRACLHEEQPSRLTLLLSIPSDSPPTVTEAGDRVA